MNLNSDDVYNNIESFKNKNGYTLDKMAELTGMSDKSAYSGMIKNKRMKLEYLVNLINNTGITFEQLFRPFTNYQQEDNPINKVEEPEHSIRIISCPECIEKERTIQYMKKSIDILERYTSTLESICNAGKNGAANCG